MYQKTTLDNGLRIVSSEMPHTRSVCVNIFIGAGSRYEDSERAGISHFIEHLCFKGTKRRATAREISAAIEGVGGMLNGATDKEVTIYWCRVARPHFSLAADVVVDMLRNSRFAPDDIEKERQVILEEIKMSMDSPFQRVDSLIDKIVWPNQPLGRDVIGDRETVTTLTRDLMLDYLARQYTPGNTVVSIAGALSHNEVVASLAPAFSDWPQIMPRAWYPADDEQDTPRFRLEQRKTEQAHLCLAVRGVSTLHPDRYTLDLLNVVLGAGMSSRLFQEIRERRGLAYSVHSSVDHFLDSGSVTIYAGVNSKRIDSAIEAILGELHRIRENEIPESELARAKEFSKGRLLLRMENTQSVARWIGGQELLIERIRTVDEVISIIDSITPEDINRVARKLLVTEKLNLAIVGPFRSETRFQKLLKL